MECGKIVVTRLRSSEYYKKEPLNHIVDSMYHLLDNFIEKNDGAHMIETHNCSLPSREKIEIVSETIKELRILMC